MRKMFISLWSLLFLCNTAVWTQSNFSISLGGQLFRIHGSKYYENSSPDGIGYKISGMWTHGDLHLQVAYSEMEELNILGPSPSHSLDQWTVNVQKSARLSFVEFSFGLGVGLIKGHIRGDSTGVSDGIFPVTQYDQVSLHEGQLQTLSQIGVYPIKSLRLFVGLTQALSRKARYTFMEAGVSWTFRKLD